MPTLEPDISILWNEINFKILLSERVTLTLCAHAKFLKKCCVGKKLLRRQKTQINVEIFIWKLKIKHLLNPLTGTRINIFKIFFSQIVILLDALTAYGSGFLKFGQILELWLIAHFSTFPISSHIWLIIYTSCICMKSNFYEEFKNSKKKIHQPTRFW